MLRKIKEFVYDNKYYLAGGAVVAALLYYGWRAENLFTEATTSKFIESLRSGSVSSVVVEG